MKKCCNFASDSDGDGGSGIGDPRWEILVLIVFHEVRLCHDGKVFLCVLGSLGEFCLVVAVGCVLGCLEYLDGSVSDGDICEGV